MNKARKKRIFKLAAGGDVDKLKELFDLKEEEIINNNSSNNNNNNEKIKIEDEDGKLQHVIEELKNCRDGDGNSVLHIASEMGHIYMCHFLITCGIDIDSRNGMGKAPIHDACNHGQQEIVRMLIDQAQNKEQYVNCHKDNGWTPLMYASANHYHEIAVYLLDNGALPNEINRDGASSLFLASREGDEKMVTILMKYGADLNIKTNSNRTALQAAIAGNHIGVAKILLHYGAQKNILDVCGASIWHDAAISGNVDMIKLLHHEYQIPIKGDHIRNQMPCHYAAIEGNDKFIKKMIEMNLATVNQTDDQGCSILYYAASHGRDKVVEYLLKRDQSDCDVNCMSFKRTPLHCAAGWNKLRCCELLLEYGADVNLIDKCGDSPLHVGVRNHHFRIVKLLLKYGADPTTLTAQDDKDTTNMNSLQIAQKTGNQEILELLQSAQKK